MHQNQINMIINHLIKGFIEVDIIYGVELSFIYTKHTAITQRTHEFKKNSDSKLSLVQIHVRAANAG